MSLNLVAFLYLIASVCFIQALKGLSHPTTSIRGNLFGMVGMAIAAFTTAALIVKLAGSGLGMIWVLLGLVVGGAYGAWRARTVEMTKMPELVAFFHSMIGLAAVFIAVAAVAEPWAFAITEKGGQIPGGNRVEIATTTARLITDPDYQTVIWTQEERKKGQAWGLKTVESFHTRGTPMP